ncbi:MAG TPA: heme-binding protein [Mycobacterium sp.]|nr:heme-binding protein [Mycobacterium sp.]
MSILVRSAGVLAVLGAAVVGPAATAVADEVPPPPNCTAADMAGVMSGIAAATSVYLFTHPDVNNFFTGLKDLPDDQRRQQVLNYADANPQVKADLQGMRQPGKDFRERCGLGPMGSDMGAGN